MENTNSQELCFAEQSVKILNWGGEKGILQNSWPLKQIEKTQEELTETRDALVALHEHLYNSPASSLNQKRIAELRELVKDGIGDVVVTLILLAELSDLSIEECVETAYQEISGRTGKMVDGIFVKDK